MGFWCLSRDRDCISQLRIFLTDDKKVVKVETSSLPGSVILGKFLGFSKPRLPHLYDET